MFNMAPQKGMVRAFQICMTHLMIGQKLGVPGNIQDFGEFFSIFFKNLKLPGGGPFWSTWTDPLKCILGYV